mgnify:CR=1 FL=1|tara:strand:+ start:9935 stop:10306 length:372 start_codon:yes stop_codon:yes gene_type:complete
MAHRKHIKRIDPRYFLDETVNREERGSLQEQNAYTHPLPVKKPKPDGRVRAPGTLELPDDLVRRVPKSELHPAHRVPDDDSDSIPDTIDRELVRTKVDEEFKQHLKDFVLQELAQMRERKQNG